MSTLQEAEKLLSTMTRGEKAQLLQWVAREIGEGYRSCERMGYVRAHKEEIEQQIRENEAA